MSFRDRSKVIGWLLALGLSAAGASQAQEAVRAEGLCLFDSAAAPSALYVFPADTRSRELLDRFVNSMGEESGIRMQAANVPDVAAAQIQGRRTLLYNQYVIGRLIPAIESDWALALRVAHQVGHHVSHHSFREERAPRAEEELEADRFAGYLLRRFGIQEQALRELARRLPEPGPGSGYPARSLRSTALLEGWRDRQAEESAPFSFESSRDGIPMLPVWPPPLASANAEIPKELLVRPAERPRLLDVANRLVAALDRAGYAERSYYAVPQGFALVSRMEQIEPDGKPWKGDGRWPVKAAPPPIFSLTSYLRALFSSPQGLYRVIVFVVTNRPFAQQAASQDSPPRQWVWAGANRLPTVVGFVDFTSEYSCTALIYEFKREPGSKNATVVLPGNLPGRTHLERSKILSALQQR